MSSAVVTPKVSPCARAPGTGHVRVDQPRQDGDLPERGGFGRMLRAAAHPDAREALRGGIRGVVEMYAAHRDVLRTGRDLSIEKTAATLITTADRSLCR